MAARLVSAQNETRPHARQISGSGDTGPEIPEATATDKGNALSENGNVPSYKANQRNPNCAQVQETDEPRNENPIT
jgi:hypothetical protein